MADPKIPGRMIRRSIATDKGISRMTAEETAVFCMIIPHLDSYGKLIGEPPYVKEVALPFAPWATLEVIESALKAINRLTSLKLFRHKDGRRYLHAVQFERHQQLEKDKRGMDLLPSYPRKKSSTKSATKSSTQSQVSRPRSVIKGEGKEEFELQQQGRTSDSALGGLSSVLADNGDVTAKASIRKTDPADLDYLYSLTAWKRTILTGALDKVRPGDPWQIEFVRTLKAQHNFTEPEMTGAIRMAQARSQEAST